MMFEEVMIQQRVMMMIQQRVLKISQGAPHGDRRSDDAAKGVLSSVGGCGGRQPPHDARRSDDSTKGDDDRRSDDSAKGALITVNILHISGVGGGGGGASFLRSSLPFFLTSPHENEKKFFNP